MNYTAMTLKSGYYLKLRQVRKSSTFSIQTSFSYRTSFIASQLIQQMFTPNDTIAGTAVNAD